MRKRRRKCRNCRKWFQSASSSNNWYCSEECRLEAKRNRRIKGVCKICHKEFEVLRSSIYQSKFGSYITHYCSSMCKKEDLKNRSVEVMCKKCKTKFFVYSAVAKKQKTFICLQCKKSMEIHIDDSGNMHYFIPKRITGRPKRIEKELEYYKKNINSYIQQKNKWWDKIFKDYNLSPGSAYSIDTKTGELRSERELLETLPSTEKSDSTALRDSGLSLRVMHILEREGIKDLKDLRNFSAKDLIRQRGFGIGCLKEIEATLKTKGLSFLRPSSHRCPKCNTEFEEK